MASASTACSQWRRPAFTVPNSTALRSTMLRFIVVASTSNCGSTFMIPVRHMIPPLTTLWAAERPTAPSPVHSITTSTSASMSAASPAW